jgi:O-antigen/teichoic acid export membrane protein
MYFTRYTSSIIDDNHRKVECKCYVDSMIYRGGLIFGTIFMLLLLIYFIFSINIFLLFSLISLAVYSSYLIESIRTVFESNNKILWTGGYTLVSLIFRFIFTLIGIVIGGTVWSGIFGLSLSGFILFAVMYHYLYAKSNFNKEDFISEFNATLVSKQVALFVLSFVLVSFVMYIDVLLAYYVLPPSDLSIYVASAVLSKGLLLFSLPLTKVLYPIIANNGNNSMEVEDNNKYVVIKMLGIMFVVSTCGVVVLLLLSDVLTRGSFSINYIDLEVYSSIAISVIPLTLLRSLVSISLARNNDKEPLFLIIPSICFVIYIISVDHNLYQFANDFMLFSAIILLFYLTIMFVFYYYRCKHVFKGVMFI